MTYNVNHNLIIHFVIISCHNVQGTVLRNVVLTNHNFKFVMSLFFCVIIPLIAIDGDKYDDFYDAADDVDGNEDEEVDDNDAHVDE